MTQKTRQNEGYHRMITRRGLIVGGLQATFIGILAARMHNMQVLQSDTYRFLAEENRIDVRLIAPERGLILDRYGRVIAQNEQNFGVTITREDTDDIDAVLERVSTLISLSSGQIDRVKRELNTRSSFAPVLITDGLTWDQLAMVSVNAPSLPGITAEVGQLRVYPYGPDFAHTVGYVGRVTKRDLIRVEDQDPLLRLPQFKIGKFGAESRFDRSLRGSAGNRRVEVNAVGRVMRELAREEGDRGQTIQLTLDAALQNFTAARLGNESASAVVIDTRNGDLLAAVSSPSFDPNLFVSGISQREYDKLLQNDHRPLHNKIAQGLYPPGSTFKMVTLLAGLEAGLVNPAETIRCSGFVELGDRQFHCWKRSGHGLTDARKSLTESCDTYYYDICQRVGIEGIAQMARYLGLGLRHDVAMTSISEGLIPTKDWKFRVHKQDWLIGDTLNATIGQGYVLASPLQLAVMTARLASGHNIRPRMIRSIDGIETSDNSHEPLQINKAHLDLVRDAMFDVMNSNRGTAYSSRILTAGYEWAGKTGTSQVRNITSEERARGVIRNEDLPWERRDHALFVGFAPYESPRYAISVVVEHGGGGASVAAPIARDIILYTLSNGLPPLDAYPDDQHLQIQELYNTLELRHFPKVNTERNQA